MAKAVTQRKQIFVYADWIDLNKTIIKKVTRSFSHGQDIAAKSGIPRSEIQRMENAFI